MTASAHAARTTTAPNIVFSHIGLTVKNMPVMHRFYTEVLGYTETDNGNSHGLHLVFLSRDPMEHHQIVLSDGRPENIPPNTANPMFGACIQHIAFRVSSLMDLREMCERLEKGGATNLMPANHGVTWSVYAHDPEGNPLEFYLYTDWYVEQPILVPLDLSKSDAEIVALTKELCESSTGCEPLTAWRERLAARVSPFVEMAR